MMYKVSVIIPVYNVENYLYNCLASVQAQTMQEIEVIAVNDGSTDGSLVVLEAFCRGKENYKIINQKNKGQSAARNAGLAHASGKYIYFLDSDDIIAPTLCETCYQAAEQEGLDIVLFDSVNQPEKDILLLNWMITPDRVASIDTSVRTGQAQYSLLSEKNVYRAEVWLCFIKKSFLENTGLLFKEGMIYEDVLFTPILFILANRIQYLPKLLHSRVIHEGSIMMQAETYRHSRGHLLAAQGLLLFIESNKQSLNEQTILHLKTRIERSSCRAARWCGKQKKSAERAAFQKEIQAVEKTIFWKMRPQIKQLLQHPVIYMKVFSVKENFYYAIRKYTKNPRG